MRKAQEMGDGERERGRNMREDKMSERMEEEGNRKEGERRTGKKTGEEMEREEEKENGRESTGENEDSCPPIKLTGDFFLPLSLRSLPPPSSSASPPLLFFDPPPLVENKLAT